MAAFLAAVAVGDRTELPSAVLARVQAVLSKVGDVRMNRGRQVALGLCDLGLWPGTSWRSGEGRTLVVGGDPVLHGIGGALTRDVALSRMSRELSTNVAVLRSCEGTHAGVQADHDRITAFTDKMGVRPLYWAHVDDMVFASSAQWILESLDDIPKDGDLRAAAEVAAFGYPLMDRTLRRAVRVLGAGEALTVDRSGPRVTRYWDWATIPGNGLEGTELVEHVQSMFAAAVDVRLREQQHVLAALSGGMDSRLIVSHLCHRSTAVRTLNFAPEGSQDLVFGRKVAALLGTDHSEFSEGGTDFAERRRIALDAWESSQKRSDVRVESPRLLWSGDGGSVGLGHVYIDETVVAASRRGAEAGASAIQQKNNYTVSRHVFSRAHRHLADAPLRGIVEDLASRPQVEPGRNAHLFFMLNDQRRHCASHYERIHREKVDFVLPFFDGKFVAAVAGSQVDPFLRHRLYNQIMASAPLNVGQVPWQVYPGHEPCPVSVDSSGLRQQWEDGWYDAHTSRRARRARSKRVLFSLFSASFPNQVLNRASLFAASTAGLMGVGRYEYLLNAIPPFQKAMAGSDLRA